MSSVIFQCCAPCQTHACGVDCEHGALDGAVFRSAAEALASTHDGCMCVAVELGRCATCGVELEPERFVADPSTGKRYHPACAGIGPASDIAKVPPQRDLVTCPLCNQGFVWLRSYAAGEKVDLEEGLGATKWKGALVHIECAKLAERKANAVEA